MERPSFKYGILFGLVASTLAILALTNRGWYLACLWPALSFGIVASGYLGFGPRIFGKSADGVLSWWSILLLLPFLLYLWGVWYALRFVKREAACDQLTDRIFIGRRLLSHELPPHIDHVIDLTCEFSEPNRLRSTNYHSFPILDGFVPSSGQLQTWIAEAAAMPGTIYIHCAEGHGRTGLFAAALLVKLGQFESVETALEFVKSKRPQVRLGRRQRAALAAIQPT